MIGRRGLGLRWVVVFLGLQQIVLVAVLWVVYVRIGATSLHRELVDRVKTMAHYLASSSEFALLSGNRALLPDIGKVLETKDIQAVRILDGNSRIFFQKGLFYLDETVMVIKEPVVVDTSSLWGDETVFISDVKPKRETIGQVILYVSKASTMKRVKELQRYVFIISAAALLLSAVLGIWIIQSRFLNPLSLLMSAVARISKGDFDVRVELHCNNELDDLAAAFNSMVRELRRLLKERVELAREFTQRKNLELLGELSAMLVHEVGNTLNRFGVIRYQLAREALSDQGKEALEQFESELGSLRRFTENVSLFSKKPELDLERLEINSLLKALIASIQLVTTKDVQFEMRPTPEECFVMGDQNLLNKAFLNLLNNALFASPSGGKVEVEVTKEEGQVMIAVIDHGKGIDPEVMEKIFQPFFTTKGPLGIGLGLPIAKSFIEAHGGTIEVESRPGRTSFKVRLPQFSIAQG